MGSNLRGGREELELVSTAGKSRGRLELEQREGESGESVRLANTAIDCNGRRDRMSFITN